MHFVTTMCDIVILVIANTFLCEKSLSLAFVLTMAVGCLVSLLTSLGILSWCVFQLFEIATWAADNNLVVFSPFCSCLR